MDRCVGDLCSDHHGDGSLPPKAPWRGLESWGRRGDKENGVEDMQKAASVFNMAMLLIQLRVKSTISTASKLSTQLNRPTNTSAIKTGWHVAGKAFLTFKRAKIEQNCAGS